MQLTQDQANHFDNILDGLGFFGIGLGSMRTKLICRMGQSNVILSVRLVGENNILMKLVIDHYDDAEEYHVNFDAPDFSMLAQDIQNPDLIVIKEIILSNISLIKKEISRIIQ